MGAKQSCQCGRGGADAHDAEAESPVQAVLDASIVPSVRPGQTPGSSSSTAPAAAPEDGQVDLRRPGPEEEAVAPDTQPALPQTENPQEAAAAQDASAEPVGAEPEAEPAADAPVAAALPPEQQPAAPRKPKRRSTSSKRPKPKPEEKEACSTAAATARGKEDCPGTKLLGEMEKEKKKGLTPLQRVKQRMEEEDRKAKEMSSVVDDILAGKYKGAPKAAPPKQSAEELRIRMPSKYEREMTTTMLLEGLRSQYKRIGEQRAALESSKPPEEALGQYSQREAEGLSIKDGHRSMPRPKKVSLPRDFRKFLGMVPLSTLRKHDCKASRKLLSVYGEIFDVSDRPDKYGEDGPYSWMTGNDISWGFVSGKDTPEEINKFYDMWKIAPSSLQQRKLQGLLAWVAFYEFEYGGSVGKLAEYANEPGLRGPPIEECEECSIM